MRNRMTCKGRNGRLKSRWNGKKCGRGGCCAPYFMVENRGYEWYNQNVKDIDKSEFGRYICRS